MRKERERGKKEKKCEKAKDRDWRGKMGQLKSIFKAISDVSVAQSRSGLFFSKVSVLTEPKVRQAPFI